MYDVIQTDSGAPRVAASQRLREALGLPPEDTPFPWQERLLASFLDGRIPRSLDIPTGLGKTAVMAIWLVARAHGGSLPRRLVYVVDRRAVVDQATEVAEGLRAFVDRNAEIKRKLRLQEHPLPISTLRGQYVDNKEWLVDPASPAVIVGTIDMIGSRLLFEGYGVGRKMRPYHAGLIGADTIAVLDEAHLVPPFERLLEAIAEGSERFGPRDEALRQVVPSFRLLSLSATARTHFDRSFGLDDTDMNHAAVHRRLDAVKRLTLCSLGDRKLPEELAEQAWLLTVNCSRPARCLVFCDERKVATAVKEAIDKRAKGDRKKQVPTVEVDTELFVGGRRVFERASAAKRLRELGFVAGATIERERAAFVIATSAGEVGVDLDADHMASDLVAWERMVQRLGRVNRRGEGEANVVVVVEPEPKESTSALRKAPSDRTERESKQAASVERGRAVRALIEQLRDDGETANVSPGALRDVSQKAAHDPSLRQIVDAATTAAPLQPAVSRALIDAWSMTSLKEHTGRPAIDPWLRGWVEDEPQTSVVWRVHLPRRTPGRASNAEIETFFEAAPPHASEVLETESFGVASWLLSRAKAVRKPNARTATDPENGESAGTAPLGDDDVAAFVLTPAGDLRRTLNLGELAQADRDKQVKQGLQRSITTGTLIVDARLGGLRDGLLSDTESGFPRTADDGSPWMDTDEGPMVPFRVRVIEAGQDPPVDARWRERFRLATDSSQDGDPTRWLVVEKWRADAATEDDRSAGKPQLLHEHVTWTEKRARNLAVRLALPTEYQDVLTIAARLHDEGKRAPRWQRAFNASVDGIYAKTAGPVNVPLLNGYRHELGSLLGAANDSSLEGLPDDLRDLVLHLIAAHHGFARPVLTTRSCDQAPPTALHATAREVALRFARMQQRWGPWGLAWWEALLRASDQQASRDNEIARSTVAKEIP